MTLHLERRTILCLAIVCCVWARPAQVYGQNSESNFVVPYNSERDDPSPLSPQESLAALKLPDRFSASLFAAEPDVMNPIAACTDSQGRVWVAENFTYAERQMRFDLNLSDRIIVLEDTDQDGVADKRTVFVDNLKVLTGLTVGNGGVWAIAPPQLLFIPDRDGDLIPDGPAEVKLDGFHRPRENYHNFANGLSWGPDGWLYGRSGASAPGDMGLPGSTDEQRVPIRGGIWRYHPQRQTVEALTQGTTNPWGHDWNRFGDLFFINTVNGHFWHCIPGAHFVRPHTLDVNPHSYELIDMHADHWHFDTGKSWTASRDGAANNYGGGHAHIGMLIYQERLWSDYEGRVLTVNMHGRRVNCESLQSHGSGYLATHNDDFMVSDDTWFRGMDLLPLPDGNVLLLDWSDTGECHEHTGVHRTSGRIFKIKYDAGQAVRPSALTTLPSSPAQLAQSLVEGSEWTSRKARLQLGEWFASGPDVNQVPYVRDFLIKNLENDSSEASKRLRALWGLVAIDSADTSIIRFLLAHPNEYLRSWGVRLLVDDWPIDTAYGDRPVARSPIRRARTDLIQRDAIEALQKLAQQEDSARVRLDLASTLQRLPHEKRASLASQLVRYSVDANDHNIPLMIWYGISPLGDTEPNALIEVLSQCKLPTTRRLIARRLAGKADDDPELLSRAFEIAAQQDARFQADVVTGTANALAGKRKATAPRAWEDVFATLSEQADGPLTGKLQSLNILFGDGQTIEQLKKIAEDGRADLETRKSAIRTLVDSRAPGIKNLCLKLLSQRWLNSVAAAGLAREADPTIGPQLVKNYRRFHPSERSQAISVLTSRPAWARDLLVAVQENSIDASEISAFQARQIASHDDAQLSELLSETWGRIRNSPSDKQQMITSLRTSLDPAALASGNKQSGFGIFQKTCAKCHKLFGEGGDLGPDLTGAQRANLDYLLENIVDPSAVVTKEFRATTVLLGDGRVLSGLVTERSESGITLATQDETFRIPADEIEREKQTSQSTMPDGLLDQLTPDQIRDLFSYLQSTEQITFD